jgi:hypothetical protein
MERCYLPTSSIVRELLVAAEKRVSGVVRDLLVTLQDAQRKDLEYHLNILVGEAFELSPREIGILERSLPLRDPIELLSATQPHPDLEETRLPQGMLGRNLDSVAAQVSPRQPAGEEPDGSPGSGDYARNR